MLRAVVLALLCLLPTGAAVAATAPLDRILVIVNDDIITENEFRIELRRMVQDLRARGVRLPSEEVVQRQALERMIVDRIQLQYAERVGVRVGDPEIDSGVESIARRNGLSMRALREALERDGIDYTQFRQSVANQLTIQRLIDREINSRVTVTPEEIESFLASRGTDALNDEFDVSHILIAVPESATARAIEEARRRAETAVTRISSGLDFEQAAAEYSNSQDALSGGRLGWRKAGQLPGLFLEALAEMQIDEVSGILRSPSGFHILKLNERRGGGRQMVVQTQVRHILLRPNEFLNAREVRQRLAQIRERIVNGEDFAQLAKTHSEDNVSRGNGGELGWVGPGEMMPTFEDAMEGLAPGEVSQPVPTQFGLHLIQVLGRRQHDAGDQIDRNNARQQILVRKSEERYDQWLRELRDEAFVEMRMEY